MWKRVAEKKEGKWIPSYIDVKGNPIDKLPDYIIKTFPPKTLIAGYTDPELKIEIIKLNPLR